MDCNRCESCGELREGITGFNVPWTEDGASLCPDCCTDEELIDAAEAVEATTPGFPAAEWIAENL